MLACFIINLGSVIVMSGHHCFLLGKDDALGPPLLLLFVLPSVSCGFEADHLLRLVLNYFLCLLGFASIIDAHVENEDEEHSISINFVVENCSR